MRLGLPSSRKLRTKTPPRLPFPAPSVTFPALHAEDISSCGKGCSRRPLAGPYFVHRHLPLVWDISVASRTSSSSGIKSALSGSLTFHCWMTFPPLLPIQAVFLTKAFVMREVDLSRVVMTIDKGTADHEISALSHIALLQGPLQGREKGFQNVDSSPTPPLSPTRAPRPASRESCGGGTMVQCLVQQAAVHHMHHAPLRGANPWFGQRQLARVPHIPSHGTMTPPNTLILRSTLRKKLIKISRASNFAAVPPVPVHECDFFLSALFVPSPVISASLIWFVCHKGMYG